MMIVRYKQIQSSASPDDNQPWYELSVSDGSVVIDVDGDGSTDADLSDESVSIDTSANSVVAVSADEELISYPIGERHELRAHLAWYNADGDTLTLLEFVEY